MLLINIVLIYVKIFLGAAVLGFGVLVVLHCSLYVKKRMSDIFILNKKKREHRRKEQKLNKYMKQAIPELYRYFTWEQREYCLLAPTLEEACFRYREVVMQNPDIVRAYFNDMMAKMQAETKDK